MGDSSPHRLRQQRVRSPPGLPPARSRVGLRLRARGHEANNTLANSTVAPIGATQAKPRSYSVPSNKVTREDRPPPPGLTSSYRAEPPLHGGCELAGSRGPPPSDANHSGTATKNSNGHSADRQLSQVSYVTTRPPPPQGKHTQRSQPARTNGDHVTLTKEPTPRPSTEPPRGANILSPWGMPRTVRNSGYLVRALSFHRP